MSSLSASGNLYLRYSGGAVQYSTDGTSYTNVSSWPVTITNLTPASTLYVNIVNNITLTGATSYFICGSDNIQFGNSALNPDGTRTTITVNNAVNYPGLIRNGTGVALGKNNITIINLQVIPSGTTTLTTAGGWIGQINFCNQATGNLIQNCCSTGTITDNAGGIVGNQCAKGPSSLTINGCFSTGIIGDYGGGITGRDPGITSGTVIITKCFSTGQIGASAGYAGGLIGNSSGGTTSIITISECYSTGAIATTGAGGLVGNTAFRTSGSIQITKSYSTGIISGIGAGGIVGTGAVSITCVNCYSTGTLSGNNTGGIFGNNIQSGSSATNCYTTGTRIGGSSGGIYALSTNDNLYGSNNYAEGNHSSSGWSTANAQLYLQSVGTVWINPGIGSPYLLKSMGYSQYSTDPTTSSYTLSFNAGDSTDPALDTTNTYSILDGPAEFTIDGTTGVVTADVATVPGSYTIIVLATSSTTSGLYNITEMFLTILSPEPDPTGESASGSTTTACCTQSITIGWISYEFTNDIQIGKGLLFDKQNNPNLRFTSFSDYVRYLQAAATRG